MSKAPTKTGGKLSSAFETFLGSQKAAVRFRQSDVAEVLYPLTRPRDHTVAGEQAASFIRDAAKQGRIERTGHLHWKTRPIDVDRRLLDGRKVTEGVGLAELMLRTRCPGKWAAVDLETGEIYQGASGGSSGGTWERANPETRAAIAKVASKDE